MKGERNMKIKALDIILNSRRQMAPSTRVVPDKKTRYTRKVKHKAQIG